MWPQLEARGEGGLRDRVEKLTGLLAAEDFYESFAAIGDGAGEVAAAFHALYGKTHADRYHAAVEQVKGRPEWEAVPESMRQPVLHPLAARSCPDADLPAGSLACKACGATLSQMESDLAASCGLLAQVIGHVQKLTTPPETKLQRVRVSESFGGAMENEGQVREAAARLQDYLLKLLDEKVKIVVE